MALRTSAILGALLASAACGDDGGGPAPAPDAARDIGFGPPRAILKANVNRVEVGDADLSCLGAPASDPATTVAVALTTQVRDFQNMTAVPGAVVTAFRDQDVGAPFATATADGSGGVTLDIPVGTKRFGFKMTHPSSLDTLLLNQTVEPGVPAQTQTEIQIVSVATATLLPAVIRVERTPGTGVLAGSMSDCQGRAVSNFIATVSSTRGAATPVPGADTYYFDVMTPLPVAHNLQGSATANGLFMVIELAPTASAYVQVWGFPTAADLAAGTLRLVAELPAAVLADTVITGAYEPLRSGA